MKTKLVRSLFVAAASAALLGGCAAASEGSGSTAEALSRGNRNLITSDEIATVGVTNLYDAVQRLRPQWLRGGPVTSLRGSGSGLPVVVYQNNTPLGGLDALRQMQPGFATSLRFLDGPTASNTLPGLGSRTVAGAIVIVTPAGS
jgi:hypothetical protein